MFPQSVTPRRTILTALFVTVAGCAGSTPPAGPLAPPPARDGTSQGTQRARTPADVEKGFQTVLASLDLDGQAVGQAPDKQVTALVVFTSWCRACRTELALLGELRQEDPRLRVIGINYLAYEEYAERGDDRALRAFLAESAPWLQVVRADDALMDALGRPTKVPSLLLFDSSGRLVRAYLRARRRAPTKDELRASILAVMSPRAPSRASAPGPSGAIDPEPGGAR